MALQPCPNCNAPISPRAFACPKCGEPDPFGKKRCVECGYLIDKDSTTCVECGEPDPFIPKRDVIELDPDKPGALVHTKFVEGYFNRDSARNWKDLVHVAHIHAFRYFRSFVDLKRASLSNISETHRDDSGYCSYPDIGISIQGQNADNSWRSALHLAKQIPGSHIEVLIQWRNKEKAAHPGRRGRLFWKSEEPLIKPAMPTREQEKRRPYQCTRHVNYASRKPYRLSLLGSTRAVRTWKDVLLGVCEILREQHPTDFDKILNLDKYYSRKPVNFHTPMEISSTGIYVETNRGANTIMQMCKKTLIQFGYSENDIMVDLQSHSA